MESKESIALIKKDLQIAIMMLNHEIELLRKDRKERESWKIPEPMPFSIGNNMYIVSYKKCCALFGNSKPIKDDLKENFSAIFNSRLKDPTKDNTISPGWIIKKDKTTKLMSKYPDIQDKLEFHYIDKE